MADHWIALRAFFDWAKGGNPFTDMAKLSIEFASQPDRHEVNELYFLARVALPWRLGWKPSAPVLN